MGFIARDYALPLAVIFPVAALVLNRLERRGRLRVPADERDASSSWTIPWWAAVVGYVALVAATLLALFEITSDPQSELWPALAARNFELSHRAAVILSCLALFLAAAGTTDVEAFRSRPSVEVDNST